MCFLINVHESPWQQSCVCKWLADATITDQTSLLSQLNYNDPYWPKMVLGQCNLHKEPVWNLWRCNSLGPLKQIHKYGEDLKTKKLLCYPSVTHILHILLQTSHHQLFCFLLFLPHFFPHSLQSSPPKSNLLIFPFFPSLEALAPLAGSLPLGVLAEKLSLIHPQRALWLTRLAQGRRAELREEGRAVSTELSNDRAIYYREKMARH